MPGDQQFDFKDFTSSNLDKLDLEIHRGSEFKNWKSQWEAFVRLS